MCFVCCVYSLGPAQYYTINTHTSLQRGTKEDLSFVRIGSHTPTIDEIAEL